MKLELKDEQLNRLAYLLGKISANLEEEQHATIGEIIQILGFVKVTINDKEAKK